MGVKARDKHVPREEKKGSVRLGGCTCCCWDTLLSPFHLFRIYHIALLHFTYRSNHASFVFILFYFYFLKYLYKVKQGQVEGLICCESDKKL